MIPFHGNDPPTLGSSTVIYSRWQEEAPPLLSRGTAILLVFGVIFALLYLNLQRLKRRDKRWERRRLERKRRLAQKISVSHRKKAA